MPRVTLIEQLEYEFSHNLTVRTTDINYAGHLGNEALLGLVHEARGYFLKELNFNTIVGTNQRIGLVIADLVLNFKAEAFVFDQLTVDCQIDELQEKAFRLFHRICCGGQVIALVETGVVAYDYNTRHVVSLPNEFLIGLKNFRNKQVSNTGDIDE